MGLAGVTLYAKWMTIYTVTYHANGGTGTAPTESDKAADATFVAADNTFIAPSGKQFKHWNTAADGTGTSYAAGATVTMPASALNLYAIWEDISLVTYAVTYHTNGGTGTVPTESDKTQGETFTAASADTLTPPDGKRFKEWNTKVDGTGTAYMSGATIICRRRHRQPGRRQRPHSRRCSAG